MSRACALLPAGVRTQGGPKGEPSFIFIFFSQFFFYRK